MGIPIEQLDEETRKKVREIESGQYALKGLYDLKANLEMSLKDPSKLGKNLDEIRYRYLLDKTNQQIAKQEADEKSKSNSYTDIYSHGTGARGW